MRDILGELTPVEQKLAPSFLHVAGHVDLLRTSPKVAVVGSRRASPEGLTNATQVAETLVKLGATVVSGLAEGIDTAAHKAAIRARGRTFAVVGTGLDVAYPRVNRPLQEHLMAKFAVVSQFRAGSPPARRNFPQRNRTMALLSDALVIVEASQKSGTISQGWETLRLGRTLFLMESVVDNPALSWPAEMRRYGAEVLRLKDLDRVLDDLPCVTTSGALGF
ncbi:DNA-processing protein DprA [Candidatus Palauibacter sp.]|uniref:DNA-processing protein DprA n=1 Tax=Candidatus Palauibacter sp. TaxID=3101350 RepID=UPI003AF22B81